MRAIGVSLREISTQPSSRLTPATTPSKFSIRTAGSACGIESPRVITRPGNFSTGSAATRCRKNRPHLSYKTISPTCTSRSRPLSIETTSPGHRVGSMLLPETCKRQRPCDCNTSTVISCFGPTATFIINLGVLPVPECASPLRRRYFAASQRHRFEYSLVAKGRLPIWFFGTLGCSGNGHLGTGPILNLHRTSRNHGNSPCLPLWHLGEFVSQKCTPIGPDSTLWEGPTDGGYAPTKEPSVSRKRPLASAPPQHPGEKRQAYRNQKKGCHSQPDNLRPEV